MAMAQRSANFRKKETVKLLITLRSDVTGNAVDILLVPKTDCL